MDPTAQRKKSLMRSACAWCVCARYIVHVLARVQSSSHALLRLVDELLRQRGAVHERDELVGPRPAQPMPWGALRRLDRLAAPTVDSWSTGVDAYAPSELRKFLQNQFSFSVENVRFVIFHPKLAQPPPPVSKCVTFRKKKSEFMRGSLKALKPSFKPGIFELYEKL